MTAAIKYLYLNPTPVEGPGAVCVVYDIESIFKSHVGKQMLENRKFCRNKSGIGLFKLQERLAQTRQTSWYSA